MDIFKITALAICGAILTLIVKENKPAIAICIGIICTLILFFEILGNLSYIFTSLSSISSHLSFSYEYMETIIKITGVSYISKFGTDICRDAGNAAIATTLEIAGKIIIIVLSLPVLISVINLLVGLL